MIFNDPKCFIDFIKSEKIQNLLLGNGYCCSHPIYSDLFKFNEADRESIKKEFMTFDLKQQKDCPEEYMSKIRFFFLREIVKQYHKKISNRLSYESIKNDEFSSINFLKLFNNIFTLNYDPLMYANILEYREYRKFGMVDGFNVGKYIDQDAVIKRIEEKWQLNDTKIYYIHGSCFLKMDKENSQVTKLSLKKNGDHNKLFENDDKIPFLILEDRFEMKGVIIDREYNKYFKGCLTDLESCEGDLLVFGVSFERDDHILKAIKKKLSNTNLTQTRIYITSYENESEKIKNLKNEFNVSVHLSTGFP